MGGKKRKKEESWWFQTSSISQLLRPLCSWEHSKIYKRFYTFALIYALPQFYREGVQSFLDFLAWFLSWHAVWIVRPFWTMFNQLNLNQWNFNSKHISGIFRANNASDHDCHRKGSLCKWEIFVFVLNKFAKKFLLLWVKCRLIGKICYDLCLVIICVIVYFFFLLSFSFPWCLSFILLHVYFSFCLVIICCVASALCLCLPPVCASRVRVYLHYCPESPVICLWFHIHISIPSELPQSASYS